MAGKLLFSFWWCILIPQHAKGEHVMFTKLAEKPVEQEQPTRLPDVEQLVKEHPELTREFIEDIVDAERAIAEGRTIPYKFG